MNPTQILLSAVVVVLTSLLVTISYQVFMLLRELRRSTEKLNQILSDATFVSSSVARPVATISSFLEGIRGFKDLVDLVSKVAHHESSGQLSSGEREERHESGYDETYSAESRSVGELQERGRRFFHKDGKPLSS